MPALHAIRRISMALALTCLAVATSTAQPAPRLPSDRGEGIYRSDRLGIEYQLRPYGGHKGVLLTRPPGPGSPFLRVRRPSGEMTYLEKGDMIVGLDGQVIDVPLDLEAHVRETPVEIVNVNGGVIERVMANFPAVGPAPRPVGPTTRLPIYRSDRLGIDYKLTPYRGHLGAILASPPRPDSPFLKIRRESGEVTFLEPGDMIVTLDRQVIDGPEDIEGHVRETRVEFVNINGLKLETVSATFPDRVGPGGQVLPSADESRRVRAILVLDTDSNLPGLEMNRGAIEATLGKLDPKRVDITVIEGRDVTSANILAQVARQGDCSGDTLLVYVASHAATDLGRGHTLTLTRGPDRFLLRSKLALEMARLRPRLAVLMTDGCSNLVVIPPEPDAKLSPAPQAPAGEVEDQPRRIVRSLLLRTKGFVDINGSTFDPAIHLEESGLYNRGGGFFTNAFGMTVFGSGSFQALDRDGDGLLTWSEAMPPIRKRLRLGFGLTRRVAMSRPEKLAPDILSMFQTQLTQTPQAFSLDGPLPERRTDEVFYLGVALTNAKAVDPAAGSDIFGVKIGDLIDGFEPLGSGVLGNLTISEGDLLTAVNGRAIASTKDLKGTARRDGANVFRLWSSRDRAYYTYRHEPPAPPHEPPVPAAPPIPPRIDPD